MCGFYATDERIKKLENRKIVTLDELPIFSKTSRADHSLAILSNTPNTISLTQWGFNLNFSNVPVQNAQAEKLNSSPIWKPCLENGQFCIIPINSFYEFKWMDEKGKVKVPYRIGQKDFPIIGLAGLYQEKDGIIQTTSITQDASNHMMANIHNGGKNSARSPFLLTESEWYNWLNAKTSYEALNQIKLTPEDQLEAYSISRTFNKPSADKYSLDWYIKEEYRGGEQGSLF